jgi:hypothetical protein
VRKWTSGQTGAGGPEEIGQLLDTVPRLLWAALLDLALFSLRARIKR